MNVRTRLFLAAASTALLASCATMDDGYATSRSMTQVADAEYMAAVEQLATRNGVEVVWVNPPEVKVDDNQE